MKKNYFSNYIDMQVNNANPDGANALAINQKNFYFLFLENYWN